MPTPKLPQKGVIKKIAEERNKLRKQKVSKSLQEMFTQVTTKFVILNDRKIPMIVNIIDVGTNQMGDKIITIEPASMQVLEITIPSNTLPYFKIWENNMALLSFCDETAVDNL